MARLFAAFAAATASTLIGGLIWAPTDFDAPGTIYLLIVYWPVTVAVLAVAGAVGLVLASGSRQSIAVVKKRAIVAIIATMANVVLGGFVFTWLIATISLYCLFLGLPVVRGQDQDSPSLGMAD